MIKWAGSKRKTWVKKTDMNCYQLLLEFERKNGPKVLGKLHPIIIHMYLVNTIYIFDPVLNPELHVIIDFYIDRCQKRI